MKTACQPVCVSKFQVTQYNFEIFYISESICFGIDKKDKKNLTLVL